MQAAQVVQQIIAEVFSLIVLNYDKSIAESEAIIATNNSVLNTIQNTVIQASIEAGDPTLFDKINEEVEKEYQKGSLESLRSELAQTEKDLEAEKKMITVAPQDRKVDHIAKLAEFRKAFEEE